MAGQPGERWQLQGQGDSQPGFFEHHDAGKAESGNGSRSVDAERQIGVWNVSVAADDGRRGHAECGQNQSSTCPEPAQREAFNAPVGDRQQKKRAGCGNSCPKARVPCAEQGGKAADAEKCCKAGRDHEEGRDRWWQDGAWHRSERLTLDAIKRFRPGQEDIG